MQLARDARPLFQLDAEFLRKLMQTDAVKSPINNSPWNARTLIDQNHQVPYHGGRMRDIQGGVYFTLIPTAGARLNLQRVMPGWKSRIGRDASIAFRLVPFRFESHQFVPVPRPRRIDITEGRKIKRKNAVVG